MGCGISRASESAWTILAWLEKTFTMLTLADAQRWERIFGSPVFPRRDCSMSLVILHGWNYPVVAIFPVGKRRVVSECLGTRSCVGHGLRNTLLSWSTQSIMAGPPWPARRKRWERCREEYQRALKRWGSCWFCSGLQHEGLPCPSERTSPEDLPTGYAGTTNIPSAKPITPLHCGHPLVCTPLFSRES